MKLAFDIGCNEGKVTILLLEQYDSVVGVEPNPGLAKKLTTMFEHNPAVKIVCAAVSNGEFKEVDFYISPEHTISTVSQDWMTKSRFSKKSKWNSPIKVPTITLDELIKIHGIPDIIKIDVEGYEKTVLEGLSFPVKYICFEWASELFANSEQCIKILQNIGISKFAMTYGEYIPGIEDVLTFCKWEDLDFDIYAHKQYGMIWAKGE